VFLYIFILGIATYFKLAFEYSVLLSRGMCA